MCKHLKFLLLGLILTPFLVYLCIELLPKTFTIYPNHIALLAICTGILVSFIAAAIVVYRNNKNQ